jgi:hypothetical protein
MKYFLLWLSSIQSLLLFYLSCITAYASNVYHNFVLGGYQENSIFATFLQRWHWQGRLCFDFSWTVWEGWELNWRTCRAGRRGLHHALSNGCHVASFWQQNRCAASLGSFKYDRQRLFLSRMPQVGFDGIKNRCRYNWLFSTWLKSGCLRPVYNLVHLLGKAEHVAGLSSCDSQNSSSFLFSS